MMKEKIIGYLQSHTSKNSVWVDLNEVFNGIVINKIPEEIISFEIGLNQLVMEGSLQFKEEESDLYVGLRETVKQILDDIKLSAIEEMQQELDRCVEEEDYEEASEYRDMINEAKKNREESDDEDF